jgi:hypothetical protein
MKKLLLLLSLFFVGFVSTSAHAATWDFTCKTADNSLVISSDAVIVIEDGKDVNAFPRVRAYDNLTPNDSVQKDTVVEFGYREGKYNETIKKGTLKVYYASKPKYVGEHDEHTATLTYEVKGILDEWNDKTKVTLTCWEYSAG